MKHLNFTLITLIFLFLFGFKSDRQDEGIHFFKGTLKEAKVLAAESNKDIFIDCYTVWCGPCKAMSSRVFTDAKVGRYYNDNFINIKMDMEKGEGIFLGKKFNVTAYPTLIYLDKNGKEISREVGYLNKTDLITAGKSAVK